MDGQDEQLGQKKATLKETDNENARDKKQRYSQNLAALKQSIISAIDVKGFYEQATGEKLKITRSDGWADPVHCVLHNDTGKSNLSVNIHTGGFKCFACGKSGSIFDFWCYSKSIDPKVGFQNAIVELANKANINIEDFKTGKLAPMPVGVEHTEQPKAYVPAQHKAKAIDAAQLPIKKAQVKKYHANLNSEHYKYLHFVRGLNDASIAKFQIGWNPNLKYKDKDGIWRSGKFTIPIYAADDQVRNIRVYCADGDPQFKMINTKGYGSPPRLFPLPLIRGSDWEHVCITEGEWDCMLLNQKFEEAGLSKTWGAVTGTHGCSKFEEEWIEYLLGRNVYFIFDCDSYGKQWAGTHATEHFIPAVSTGNCPSVKIVNLPLEGTKDYKDITDYFVKMNYSLEDFIILVEGTKPLVVGGMNRDELEVEPLYIENFISCVMDRQYIDSRVRVPLTISGQSTRIYHATRILKVTNCPMMKDGNCCAMHNSVQTIPYGHTSFIEACMASKKEMTRILQDVACNKNKPCTIEEVEKVVMEQYFGHQVIKRLTAEDDGQGHMVNTQELVTSSVYVLQPEENIRISPQDYIATGYVRSHPGTRQVCLFVEHLEAMEEDWQKFEVNESAIMKLKKIQNFESVKSILDEITNHVTKIYKADDILLTVLLTYLSPLRFAFNGSLIRGWINACILGDTGTGKSATYQRISDWLELGDLFSALSGTRTGLLYSVKQKGVEWYVQIGRYVMASGKIIAIDETQEMLAEEIKKMAIAMDEGWLEVSQVASGGYRTTARALFLMNPKGGKKISDFAYGCQALTECFDPMFIRRLDIAIFTSSIHDYKFYNQYNEEVLQQVGAVPKLNSEVFKNLVYWAWTRSINDVHWTNDATKECLEHSINLANIYGQADDVPLVNPQDFRNNLARLATSFAILSGSFTDDYLGVVVQPEHVMKMAMFIDTVYSAASCNLRQYNKINRNKKILDDFEIIKAKLTKIINFAKQSGIFRIREGKHFQQLILLLQNQQYVKKRDLLVQLGVSVDWVQKHIAILQGLNLVELGKGGSYKATRKFNLFLQKWFEDPIVEKEFNEIYSRISELALTQYTEKDLEFSDVGSDSVDHNDPFRVDID